MQTEQLEALARNVEAGNVHGLSPDQLAMIARALRLLIASTSTRGARVHHDPHDDVPRRRPEPYTGPLPTIADERQLGLQACIVTCAAAHCWQERRIPFDELGLPDDTPFVHIAARRRFRCLKCGSREVRITADWRDVAAQGTGRRPKR